MNKIDEKSNNLNSSDIFEMTSTMTYKEKLSNLESINSHKVGDLKHLENNEDSINLKKLKINEQKLINFSLNNEPKNKNNIKTVTYKTDYNKKMKINISEDTFFEEFKIDNKGEYFSSNNKYNTTFDFSNSLHNEKKHIINNGDNIYN